MDLKQALQQQRSSACVSSLHQHKNHSSTHSGPSPHSSCSNSTNTAEDSNHGISSSPTAHNLFSCINPSSAGESNHGSSPSAVLLSGGTTNIAQNPRRPSELSEADDRVLKLARFHDPPSPHSTLETQALINLHGSSCSFNNKSPLSFLSNSANNSNHPSPTTNYQSISSTLHSNNLSLQSSFSRGEQLSSYSFNGGASSASPLSKLYPFASLATEADSRSQHSFLNSTAHASSQGAIAHLSTVARNQYLASLSCLNPGPSSIIYTPEQLVELTQQTYVFKHFAAGVTPPPALLLPIINSVASSMISRSAGTGPLQFGINAGLYNVGPLRGQMDLEPGRCRRTDGKKWRCAREVVPDQKYCERHMHRGRHRARGKLNATMAATSASTTSATTTAAATPADPSPYPSKLTSQNVALAAVTSNKSGYASNAASMPLLASNSISNVVKEPQLQFSLQQPASRNASRSLGAILSTSSLASRNVGEQPPNLADLLNGTSSAAKLNFNHRSGFHESQTNVEESRPAIPFGCQSGTDTRDADNLVLRHLVGINKSVTDPPPPGPPTLSWIEQLADEQSKRNRIFNSELSMSNPNPSLRSSPLSLSSKFGSDHEDIVDTTNYMGLSISASTKTIKEEDAYGSRSTWVPIAWDNPSINGGPLGEALQANNGAASVGNFSDSLANNVGEGCMNLIDESWDHEEHVSSSPAKGHSLASPTGVLQIKASFGSYSDSSSSASSPRSALKLESSANLAM